MAQRTRRCSVEAVEDGGLEQNDGCKSDDEPASCYCAELQQYSKFSKAVTTTLIKDPVQHSEYSSPHCSDDDDDDEDETTVLMYTSYGGQPSIDLKAAVLNNPSHVATDYQTTDTDILPISSVEIDGIEELQVATDYQTTNNDITSISSVEIDGNEETSGICTDDTVTTVSHDNNDNSDNNEYCQVNVETDSDKKNKHCLCKEWTPMTKCLTINFIIVYSFICAGVVLGVRFAMQERNNNSIKSHVAPPSIYQQYQPKTETINIDWAALDVKGNTANISWVDPGGDVVSLNKNNEVIYFKQNGLYLLVLSLNFQDLGNVEALKSSDTMICLKSNAFEERCKRVSLRKNEASDVTIITTSKLRKGDFCWVTLYRPEKLYKFNAGNYLILTLMK